MISELIKSAEYFRLAIISYSQMSRFDSREVVRLHGLFISMQDNIRVLYGAAYYNGELDGAKVEKLQSLLRFDPTPYFDRLRGLYREMDLFD